MDFVGGAWWFEWHRLRRLQFNILLSTSFGGMLRLFSAQFSKVAFCDFCPAVYQKPIISHAKIKDTTK